MLASRADEQVVRFLQQPSGLDSRLSGERADLAGETRKDFGVGFGFAFAFGHDDTR
jgi:hypothetical protein